MAEPPTGRGEKESLEVSIVAEQLRRAVPGGIGTYTRGLLMGLSKLASTAEEGAGLSVEVVASRPRRRGPDQIAGLGFPVRTSRLPGPLLTRAWDRGLCGLPTVGAGAVVHSVSSLLPPLRRAPAARSGGGPPGSGRGALTATVHDLAWRRLPDAYPARGRRWHEAALERVARRATAIVVPSDATRRDLVAYGVEDARVSVIDEGVDHLPPPDHAAARRLLEAHGTTGGFILSVGTLEPRKNLRRLFAAYALARHSLSRQLHLVVAGAIAWERAQALGSGAPPEGVVLAGEVAEPVLAALYESARVVAYVPLLEGFGLPPVEAMSRGAAVLSSTGVPSTEGVGVRVDPYDTAAMAEALVTLSGDNATRAAAIEAGRARAAGLSWESTAARHLALWRSLAGKRDG